MVVFQARQALGQFHWGKLLVSKVDDCRRMSQKRCHRMRRATAQRSLEL